MAVEIATRSLLMSISGLLKLAAVSLLTCGLVVSAVIPEDLNQGTLTRQFIGTWRLVKIEGGSGGSTPWDNPSGHIVYDGTGHMAVQLNFRPGSPAMTRSPNGLTVEDKAKAFDSYYAYFGTYTVDAKAGMVTHHLEGSNKPGSAGTDNLRYFELFGNHLTLYVTNVKDGVLQKKDAAATRLIWERVEPGK
jgi:hypothetical protein